MAENIFSATDKSSRINKRVQEDDTLIKKEIMAILSLIEVKIILSQAAVNQQNHFSDWILIIIWNHTIKAKRLPLSQLQNSLTSSYEQCAEVTLLDVLLTNKPKGFQKTYLWHWTEWLP